MTGTPIQVEWAERIKELAGEEFDRVERALRSVAVNQTGSKLAETELVLAILAENREAVMNRSDAGYFIRDWQEINDQVRTMIIRDPRFQAINAERQVRHKKAINGRGPKHMNIRPLYDRLVVERSEEQETARNGIIIPDSAQEKPQQGTVIAVGNGKRLDNGTLVALDVKAGDRILFSKYAGGETKFGGTEYIIIREDDVLGILDATDQSTQSAD